MQFKAVSDCAILVEFGDKITAETTEAIRKFDRVLSQTPLNGVLESTVGLVNILVKFDPIKTDFKELEMALRALHLKDVNYSFTPQTHNISICYEGECASDLTQIALKLGLSEEAIINAHLSGEYEVLIYGFSPGYAYLRGVPDVISLPRKEKRNVMCRKALSLLVINNV